MRAVIVSLPKSGTRMIQSLLDSHPEISCKFGNSGADVPVVHFHNLRWKWLTDPNVKVILLERSYIEGAISEMVDPYGERASGRYDLSQKAVQVVARRRQLYTELLRPHADLVLQYETITESRDVREWRCDGLCDLLGISRRILICSMRRLPRVRPKNVEELRCGTLV